MQRKYGINKTERGLRVYNDNRADKPNCGEFGTIIVPPYNIKADTLRTSAQQWILLYEECDSGSK